MGADQETAERLLKLSAEEAAAEFGRLGCGVTAEELDQLRGELAEAAKHVDADGELELADLENVAGGKDLAKSISTFAWGVAGGAATVGLLVLGW